jgi:hypothetical protein
VSGVSHKYAEAEVNPTHGVLIARARKAVDKMAPTAIQRKPLLREHLRSMACKVDLQSGPDVTEFFMVLLGFRAFSRGSELVDLLRHHLFVEQFTAAATGKTTRLLWMLLEGHKTNPQTRKPSGEKQTTSICVGPDSEMLVCPLVWYDQFVRVGFKHNTYAFSNQSGTKMAKATVRHVVNRWLQRIGLDPAGYGGHSLRSGGATEALRKAVDVRLIAKHGRWKSDAVYLYMHDTVTEQLLIHELMGGVSISK